MQKTNLFSFLLDGGTLPPPGIRALRARHARLRAWRSSGGGRAAAAADRNAKENKQVFGPTHVYFKSRNKVT